MNFLSQDGKIKELCWEQNQIPDIFTPINELELLKNKRLIILVWYIDETLLSQIVVGQLNVPLMNFYQINPNDTSKYAKS